MIRLAGVHRTYRMGAREVHALAERFFAPDGGGSGDVLMDNPEIKSAYFGV